MKLSGWETLYPTLSYKEFMAAYILLSGKKLCDVDEAETVIGLGHLFIYLNYDIAFSPSRS